MASFPDPVQSKALVLSSQAPSHDARRSLLEDAVDEVYRNSMEVAKFERSHLGPLLPQVVIEARPRRLVHVLPPLSGAHSVGHTSSVIEGLKGKIGVEVYAPTRKGAGDQLLMHPTPGDLFDTVLSEEQRQTLHTHSREGIDPVGKFPVIVFSHGLGVNPNQYRLLLEELASHGYVVVSLNHPTSSGYAPFSREALDSKAIDSLEGSDPQKFYSTLENLAETQAENIQFAVGRIRDGVLGDLGDRDQIVLAGHSLGGASSILVARGDPGIKGCINLDGYLEGPEATRTDALAMPVLTVLADHEPHRRKAGDPGFERESQKLKEWDDFHHNSSSPPLTIKETNHMDFTATPILSWLIGDDTLPGALKTHRAASRAMLQFVSSLP